MEALTSFIGALGNIIWGPITLVLLLGTGVYLTLRMRAKTQRNIFYAFRMMWQGRKVSEEGKGEISPFNALMTALAATVGTGNIAGVATAIFLGGPGAIFWMWVTAVFGMATKYSESVLAVKFRETDELGNHVGGPMYYIKNGLGAKWNWLAFMFAFFGMIAAFGIGNTIQSNAMAHVIETTFSVPPLASGVVIAILAGSVLIGGIKRIGEVAGKLVPAMAILYVLGALIIIIANIGTLPAAVATILQDAFTGTAAAGGFAGATVIMAMRFGVARGIFSNEAGLGTAPIAHASAKTNDPVRQGTIASLGTFIDTIVVCTMTALVIVMTGVWQSGETGAALSAKAFSAGLTGGEYVVTFGLIVFAFTTILGWSFYGERCIEYLFGVKLITPYRILWILAIPLGAIFNLNLLWLIADVLNGLMALPNLIAILLLSPIIIKTTREYFAKPVPGMT